MVVVLCSRKCLNVINKKGQQLLNFAKEIYLPVKFQVHTVSVLCSGISKISVKQLGQLKPNSIWHHHGIGVKMGILLLIFFSSHMFFCEKDTSQGDCFRVRQPVQHQRLVRMLKFTKKQTKISYKFANKKVLIRLRGYTGWSAPLLFAYTKVRVSLVGA